MSRDEITKQVKVRERSMSDRKEKKKKIKKRNMIRIISLAIEQFLWQEYYKKRKSMLFNLSLNN